MHTKTYKFHGSVKEMDPTGQWGGRRKKMYQHHSKTTQNRLEATEHNYTTVLWNPGLKKCDFSSPDSYKIKFCIKSPKQTPSSLSRALYLFFSLWAWQSVPQQVKTDHSNNKKQTTTTKQQQPKTGILCSSSHPIKHSFTTVVENVEPSSVTQHIPCSETQKDKVTRVKPTWENKTKGLASVATSNFLFLGRNFSGENRSYSAWYSLHLDGAHKTKRVNHHWGREFFWGLTSVSRKGVITSVLTN